jgi:tRNA A37 threonylcarbamoyladenosine dehydratase
MNANAAAIDADLERRFGALRRLYGDDGYRTVRALRVAIVGVGGVGSWAAEALARSGVAALTLIDLDHVAESNVNRQVQALGSTLGAAKVEALAERIADIHPECRVTKVEAFVDEGNWPALLTAPVDALIDACDQVRAKVALAAWAQREAVPFICAGAAGGKQRADRVEIADLAFTTHDPLLAALRQRLRKQHGFPRAGPMGVNCVFSREMVVSPADTRCEVVRSDLSCHGYGSTVAVTAVFGLVAAGELLRRAATAGGAGGRR